MSVYVQKCNLPYYNQQLSKLVSNNKVTFLGGCKWSQFLKCGGSVMGAVIVVGVVVLEGVDVEGIDVEDRDGVGL